MIVKAGGMLCSGVVSYTLSSVPEHPGTSIIRPEGPGPCHFRCFSPEALLYKALGPKGYCRTNMKLEEAPFVDYSPL